MPSTTVVVGCVVGLSLLIVLILVARGRRKAAEPETPPFEPPRELAPSPAKTETKTAASEPATQEAPPPPSVPVPVANATDAHALPPTPAAEQAVKVEEPTPPSTEVVPPSIEEIVTDQVIETATEAPAPAPPVPRAGSRPDAPRRAMPSYSDISDESVAEAIRRESVMPPSPPEAVAVEIPTPEVPAARPEPAGAIAETEVAAARPALSEPKAPVAPKVPTSVARVPTAKPAVSEPRVPVAAKPALSEPRAPVAAKPALSEPRAPVAAKPAVSEPRVPVAAKPAVSEPRVPVAAKPALSESRVPVAAKPAPDEHDFSALNDAPAAKPGAAAAASAAATVAKFAPPPNPATADLEKNDPRHAAARRFARVSVSEIKLYHEDEVKAGREAKDLWKRLQQDIALARQTFDARVVPEVRQRFDYLLDEIIRQLAEGDASKLGPDAPALATAATTTESATSSPTAAPPPMNAAASGNILDPEAPTRTVRRTLEPAEPTPAKADIVEAPKPKPIEPPPPAAAPAKPAEAGKPTGLAARALPSNPETAELEKNDPRHAAARRLARLSVSEIKLYHEDEVKAGREAKDLWKRMIADIGLATQTYEKRVDKEVRDRFDYLYDEILRQLAEGDASKLGPDAPKPKKAEHAAAAAPPSPPPAAAAAAPPSPPPAAAPVPAAAPPKAEAPKPAAPASGAGPAARYAPPSNPATAELEKNDPRHAAARRLARLSVSEIKLYHEDEVKAGREAKDLWKRLITDIGLATQTYEKRVDKEVRDRFDYLYDEILRQLAEGDVSKLGPDAPKPRADA